MNRLLTISLALLLAACGEPVQGAPEPGDIIQLPPIEWRIVDRDTLRAVYQNSGMPLHERDVLQGFVGQREGHWVIYTLPPKRVNDMETRILGHELMHVALGDYHK